MSARCARLVGHIGIGPESGGIESGEGINEYVDVESDKLAAPWVNSGYSSYTPPCSASRDIESMNGSG